MSYWDTKLKDCEVERFWKIMKDYERLLDASFPHQLSFRVGGGEGNESFFKTKRDLLHRWLQRIIKILRRVRRPSPLRILRTQPTPEMFDFFSETSGSKNARNLDKRRNCSKPAKTKSIDSGATGRSLRLFGSHDSFGWAREATQCGDT